MICLAGAIPGSLLAVAGAHLTDAALRSVLNLGVTQALVRMTPGLLVTAILGAVGLGLLAGIGPALRAAGLRPVEAIRSGE